MRATSARVRDLEQSLAAALARTGTAERELESARRRIAELAAALARADPRAGDDGRDALVAELAGAIREAAAAGDRWRPDYEDLMARTGHQRRWCEYVVRDARSAVFGSGGEAPAGTAHRNPHQSPHMRVPARTGWPTPTAAAPENAGLADGRPGQLNTQAPGRGRPAKTDPGPGSTPGGAPSSWPNIR